MDLYARYVSNNKPVKFKFYFVRWINKILRYTNCDNWIEFQGVENCIGNNTFWKGGKQAN